MTMLTGFDYFVLIITIISTLTAFLNGFIKTIFSILAWFGAGYLSYALAPSIASDIMPSLFEGFKSQQIALPVSFFISYIISLILLSFLSGKILKLLHNVSGGAIDHSLGFAFGLIRGILICLVFFIAIEAIIPMWSTVDNSSKKSKEAEPAWFSKSLSYNFLNKISDFLIGDHFIDKQLKPKKQKNKEDKNSNDLSQIINSLPSDMVENLDRQELEKMITKKIDAMKKKGKAKNLQRDGYGKEQINEIENLIKKVE